MARSPEQAVCSITTTGELGAYLVQELKAVCSLPAAPCNVQNLPSRKTLQKAGFVPCGNIVVGDLPD
jgi:hypothetical protein